MKNKKELNSIVKVSLIIPVLNESETVSLFINKVLEVFKNQHLVDLEFIFIDDGSTDSTIVALSNHQKNDQRIKIVELSRNFGKEAALSAGLFYATGQVMIPIDVDLQDPPELILPMLAKWREGYEVVLGKRADRYSDTWAKRSSANWFYYIHNLIASPKLPANVGDFRLLDRTVVDAINKLPESNRFMKGLFSWVGFRTTYINYTRQKRVAGKNKFNGWKLWNFALEGLTSFSSFPLRIWTYIGLLFSLCAFVFAIFIIIKVLFFGIDVPGYASLIVIITMIGGFQLTGIGVIGEYLGRTYIESKRRPVYVVRNFYEIK